MGVRFVVPVRQSFEWMIQAVTFASHNVAAGIWNKGVMNAYLRTCAIAESVRNKVWTISRGSDTDSDAAVVSEDDGEIGDGIIQVVEEGSSVVPSLWQSFLLMRCYLDCGMHLVFHGVVAYCVERIDEFLADHGLTPSFERLVNTYMLDIQSLRLDWCKMKYFPKKQWHAENELALARIIPYVYGLFS